MSKNVSECYADQVKPNWSKCPYCGGSMKLRFEMPNEIRTYKAVNYRNCSHIEGYIRCDYCGTKSPSFVITPDMVNFEMALDCVSDIIAKAVEEQERWEKED